MKPLDHEEHIRHTFDSFCKKVIKNYARDIQDELAYQNENEKSLSYLSNAELEMLAYMPDYEINSTKFSVLDFDIAIKDTLIAESLKTLTDENRNLILYYYFLGMTDKEIAKQENLARHSIQERRTRILKKLRKFMEENTND